MGIPKLVIWRLYVEMAADMDYMDLDVHRPKKGC